MSPFAIRKGELAVVAFKHPENTYTNHHPSGFHPERHLFYKVQQRLQNGLLKDLLIAPDIIQDLNRLQDLRIVFDLVIVETFPVEITFQYLVAEQ